MKQVLKIAVERKLASQRKKRRLSFSTPLPPRRMERDYQRQLFKFVTKLGRLVQKYILPEIPKLKQRATALKLDSVDDLDEAFAKLRVELTQTYTQTEIAAIARRAGVTVEAYNRKVLEEGLKRVVGTDVFLSDPGLSEMIESFSFLNTQLITNLADDTLNRIQTTVLTNYMQGGRFENTIADIQSIIDPDDESGIAFNRAKMIARDQVNKLNGQLQQMRQTNLGVTKYIWRTSMDERVRDSHAAKEGREYSWDNPPADTGNPGEDFNCRCWGEPVLDSLLEDDE